MRFLSYIISLVWITAGMVIAGCDDYSEPAADGDMKPLVVEGWIEEGEPPIVMVTRALDLNDEESRLEDVVEKWCRVSVYDDDRQYILTARKNPAYNPSLIFTSSRLKGKIGHTYRLVVETEDTIATACATIYPGGTLTALERVRSNRNDSAFSVRAEAGNLSDDGYYKVFCKSESERRFFPAFAANFRTSDYNPEEGINVVRGVHSAFLEDENYFSEYFAAGEIVEVKLCRMEKDVYDFWQSYDSNISLSNNMFVTFLSSCKGNIRGAKGYWAAYSSSLRVIKI